MISLAPATETEYEVSDEQGRPVAGAIVEPRRFKSRRLLEVRAHEAFADCCGGRPINRAVRG